ncbi:hypothetical protein BKI51_22675 [Alphaproteobacteria bacterium AO1-B]|nr:hypothetical protein BKI51_22675 [Alphaproteobacteria bacterium AO1-B]
MLKDYCKLKFCVLSRKLQNSILTCGIMTNTEGLMRGLFQSVLCVMMAFMQSEISGRRTVLPR